MDVIKAFILGTIQGVTEFLPISSSGHLALFGHWLGLEEPDLTFDILVHFATLIAIIWTFRLEVLDAIKSVWGKSVLVPRAIGIYLVISSIPAGLVAILFKDWIGVVHGLPIWVGIILILNGFALILAKYIPAGELGLSQIHWKSACIMGIAQAIAILPGISRSGSTIISGMSLGFDKEQAARYSFLMAIPVIAGAQLLDGLDVLQTGLDPQLLKPYLVGFFAALISGLLSLKLLMWILKGTRFFAFGPYCLAMGLLGIVLSL